MQEGTETVTRRVLVGTWYEFTFPKEKAGTEEYDLEELYDQYWHNRLPEDVEVVEGEVDHEWEDFERTERV